MTNYLSLGLATQATTSALSTATVTPPAQAVNPPVNPPKRAYWVAEPTHLEDAEQWLARADKKPGTWWDDWTAWLHQRTGEMVKAYATTSRKYPALADAPGSYVMEK